MIMGRETILNTKAAIEAAPLDDFNYAGWLGGFRLSFKEEEAFLEMCAGWDEP